MKRFLMTTAIFNLLLVLTTLSSAIIAAFTKDAALLAGSVALTLVSVFPTTMMLVLCSNFKEVKSIDVASYVEELKAKVDSLQCENQILKQYKLAAHSSYGIGGAK